MSAARQYQWPHPGRAAASVACSLLAGAWVVSLRPDLAGVLALMCGAGAIFVALSVLSKRIFGAVLGAASVGAAYLLSQVGHPVTAVPAAALGTLLFLSCELAWWSGQMSTGTRWAPPSMLLRWAELAVVAVAGFSLALVAGLAGITGLGAGAAVLLAGAACALLLGVLLARAARAASQQ